MQDWVYKLVEEARANHVISYSLTYDSPVQQLEPIYYWLLDFSKDLGFEAEKLVDSFAASPGSGYFAEIGRRATVMQEQAMKYLGAVNQVIKSILNLLWDLKEFEIRLKLYDKLKSKDEKERLEGLYALKEVWLTNVDIKKGRGAINMLVQQMEFVTLRDAFMIAKSPKDVDKLDLNERVKRILKSRLAEFEEWLKRSEKELRNRYKIEKTYLKSQVASLKLYARWARPYIKAAEELLMKETREAALVSVFSTLLLDLLLFCKKKYKASEVLPKTMKIEKVRDFYGVIFIDFSFRSIPRVTGKEAYYSFGGRVDLNFKAYVFREDELKEFLEKFEKQELEEVFKISQAVTEETLKTLAEDLKHFLEEKTEEKPKEEQKKSKPSLLEEFKKFFSLKEKKPEEKPEKKEKKEKKEIKKDTWEESVMRELVKAKIEELCFKIYDIYKKAHGMPSYKSPYE